MKKILDVCCGSRMCWFEKKNKKVVFNDIREETYLLCDGRKLEIKPDTLMNFNNLDFNNNTFKLVLFDPPHLKNLGKNSWMAKKYGVLPKKWRKELKNGFDECWRVLDHDGVLIFKWSENQIKLAEVLKILERKPLFGHTTGRSGKTKWLCFMKF